MSCVAFAWTFDRTVRRIPRKLIVALALTALLVFGVVRETREVGGEYRLSFQTQLQALAQLHNPISSAISELGSSFVTVTHTLALVPASRDFDGGVSYLYALTNHRSQSWLGRSPECRSWFVGRLADSHVDPAIAAKAAAWATRSLPKLISISDGSDCRFRWPPWGTSWSVCSFWRIVRIRLRER